MSAAQKFRPSFSPGRRWRIGFDVVLRTVLVLAVLVMANYLAAKFSHRFYLSSQTRVALSARTVSVLHSLTNRVNVTLYFDRKADFFPDIVALLNEYRSVNPKISIRTVDYARDAGEAEKVKSQYKLTAATDKDLVIFDCDGRVKRFSGDALTLTKLEPMPREKDEKELEFRRKPVAFQGELVFTAMLLALENPQPLKAYFLQGHGEPSLADSGDFGYLKFGTVLEQNYVSVTNLELLGDATVPLDCNLLIIAAPSVPLTEMELQKISSYLTQGGRLFVLFNYDSLKSATGLEPILQHWGVNVAADLVQDRKSTITGSDLTVRLFNQHLITSALSQFALQIILPRPVAKVNLPNPPANAPQVDELFFSSESSKLASDSSAAPRSYPLACAVEQKAAAGMANLRGTTRIIVTGDSIFLGNHYIDAGGNLDFLNASVNWLLDRPQLLEGIGPRPVEEFRLLISRQQKQQLNWLLLGALPGGVLFFGWLVWLVRRK